MTTEKKTEHCQWYRAIISIISDRIELTLSIFYGFTWHYEIALVFASICTKYKNFIATKRTAKTLAVLCVETESYLFDCLPFLRLPFGAM